MKERYIMFYSMWWPSLAITFSHLSGSMWIPRQKNASSFEAIQSSIQFLFYLHMMWSAAQTGHASSIGTIGSRKEQCLENTAGRTSHLSVFKYFLTDAIDNMWSSIIMQKNNFVMSGVVGAFFLECSAQSYQLCSVESKVFLVRFEQLIIHDTKHPTKYTTWVFFHEYSAWLSMLKHGQVIPMILGYRSGSIFHQWLYDAKTLSFMPGKEHFTCEKSTFNVSRLQFIWNSIPLLLNHSQWFQTIWNYLLSHS